MIKVKICGLTNKEDALKACEDGADMVGFIFAKESPRCLSPKVIREIIEALPGSVGKVGLFKDEDPHEVREAVISCGLDHVQLHGGESPEYCGALKDGLRRDGIALTVIKTFKVRDRIPGDVSEYSSAADFNLFDTYHPVMMGGTGTTFDWGVLAGIKSDRPFFLAGG